MKIKNIITGTDDSSVKIKPDTTYTVIYKARQRFTGKIVTRIASALILNHGDKDYICDVDEDGVEHWLRIYFDGVTDIRPPYNKVVEIVSIMTDEEAMQRLKRAKLEAKLKVERVKELEASLKSLEETLERTGEKLKETEAELKQLKEQAQ